jgi:hypothetical protein
MTRTPQWDAWVAKARAVDILDVAGKRPDLKLTSGRGGKELTGPCPTCGGDDRFAVTSTAQKKVFNCRGCDKSGDVIELVRFLDGCTFEGAVEKLTGEPKPLPSKRKNGGGDKWPTLAEYIYRDADGRPHTKVKRCLDENGKKQYPQYHRDGDKWVAGKPGGPKIPYRLPELIAAPLTATVYHVEGEKNADDLSKIGFVATTASEGAKAKWDPALTPHFKDRHVVILPDADANGRKHAEKVAAAINDVAASVRVLDLYPELHDGSDVSDWIVDDTAGAKLAKLAKDAPLWEPSKPAAKGEDDPAPDDEAELEKLAKMPALDYERARKDAGKRLGITRLSTLDLLVKGKRAELGLDGDDDSMQGQAISFPEIEPWGEPVDGPQLLTDIATTIRKHVVMTEHEQIICALWIIQTYLINRFMISPKLSVKSVVMGSGKTTLLDVLSNLVHRAWVTGSITAAALFRVIQKWRPTLLIDEVDTFVGDNEELRGMLNHSHRYDGTVTRTVGDDHEPRKFSVYAAIALAGIGGLANTLADRSVTVQLQRRRRSEPITQLRIGRMGHLDQLRRQIVRWVADNEDRVGEREPQMPADVVNRTADNWHPLLTIAEVVGGDWPERARSAATVQVASSDDAPLLERLLRDIRAAFKTVPKAKDMLDEELPIEITADALVNILVGNVGGPWSEMGRDGKPMTKVRLARMLGKIGIAPGKVGPEEKRVSGYARAFFDDVFERYLPPEGVTNSDSRTERDEMDTSGISNSDSQNYAVRVGTAKKPNNDGLLSDCPSWEGGAGEKTHARTAKSRSDDLPYTGPVVAVPDLGPDQLDEHGVPAAAGDLSLCTYCGRPGGNRVAVDGIEVRFHRGCEEPYRDRRPREEGAGP